MKPVCGWRWRRGEYSGRDTAGRTRVRRRVVSSRRSNLCRRADATRQRTTWDARAVRVLQPGAVGRTRRRTSDRRRTCHETGAAARRWEGRSGGGIESSGGDCGRVRQRERHSGHGDEDTHAHNTLSAEEGKVQVFYPFHPLHGATVQILRRPERGDGAVSVMDRAGKRLKIPVWMLSPECARMVISEQARLSKEALLSLARLLSLYAVEDHGHDSLLSTAVEECKGGNRGAIGAVGPDHPGAKRNRTSGCNGTRRCSRSNGSHSGSGFSSERRKS